MKWLPAEFHFYFQIPVDKVSSSPTNFILQFQFQDGRRESLPTTDRYVYQHGNHYLKLQPNANGGLEGNISNLASGVFTNLIMELRGQQGSAILAGLLPPFDELFIS